MGCEKVVKVSEVMPFSPPESKGLYESRLVIDPEGVGSTKLGLNHVTVKVGFPPYEGEVHPPPYDEAYYILHGLGRVTFADLGESYDVKPDTAVFIPAGVKHAVQNIGDKDLVLLTITPTFPFEEGFNGVIDARRRAWGKSFRKVDEDDS